VMPKGSPTQWRVARGHDQQGAGHASSIFRGKSVPTRHTDEMRVGCVGCERFIEVEGLVPVVGGLGFTCTACSRVNVLQPAMSTPAPAPAAATLTETAGPVPDGRVVCPKCGNTQKDQKACHRCGLNFARARSGRARFPTDPLESHPARALLTQKWATLADRLEDTPQHHAFIELCAAQRALDFAGHVYRGLTPPGTAEDPRVSEYRDRVLRLAVAQVGSAVGTPSADAERRGRIARAATLLIASIILLMFALGYWLLSRAPVP